MVCHFRMSVLCLQMEQVLFYGVRQVSVVAREKKYQTLAPQNASSVFRILKQPLLVRVTRGAFSSLQSATCFVR